LDAESLGWMNKGSCRPQASAQGLIYKCSVQWFCHGVGLQFELACDDPRKTVYWWCLHQSLITV